jgi:hypothetical protein
MASFLQCVAKDKQSDSLQYVPTLAHFHALTHGFVVDFLLVWIFFAQSKVFESPHRKIFEQLVLYIVFDEFEGNISLEKAFGPHCHHGCYFF